MAMAFTFMLLPASLAPGTSWCFFVLFCFLASSTMFTSKSYKLLENIQHCKSGIMDSKCSSHVTINNAQKNMSMDYECTFQPEELKLMLLTSLMLVTSVIGLI